MPDIQVEDAQCSSSQLFYILDREDESPDVSNIGFDISVSEQGQKIIYILVNFNTLIMQLFK